MRSAVTVRGWFAGEATVAVDCPRAKGVKNTSRPIRMDRRRMDGKRLIRRFQGETG
ncbi:MAG: hypothetical protein NTNFB01_36140 [Nitrospira sp.]